MTRPRTHAEGIATGYRGYVLMGGRSSRYGRPKAAADWDGRSFGRVCCDLLDAAGCDAVSVVVSVRSDVPPDVCVSFVVDEWSDRVRHPLLGVRAAARDAAEHGCGLVVVATDQPFLQCDWIEQLVTQSCEKPTRVAFFGDSTQQQAFPFAAGAAAADAIRSLPLWDAVDFSSESPGELRLPSMRAFLSELTPSVVPLPAAWPPCGSINTLRDHRDVRGEAPRENVAE